METKTELSTYLTKRTTCNGTCRYHNICPEYPPLSNIKDGTGCIILHLGKVDVFYNLFLAEADGLKNEMQRTLYKMQDEDPQQYIQACTKTMTTVYGTDSKADIVPPKVEISISRVGAMQNSRSSKQDNNADEQDKSVTKVKKSNTVSDKKRNK